MAIPDFHPSPELKRLQAIELDLFKEFKRVCQKYGLRYFAAGGTMLGAARHSGFIPWDDDIDVQMYWEDFKVFEEIAQKEFKHPYFYQSFKTDILSDVSPAARIRNTETTGCTKWELDNIRNASYNRGIFIDIFLLFPVPDATDDRVRQKERIDRAWRAIRGWYAFQNKLSGVSSSYDQYLGDWEDAGKRYSIEQLKQLYFEYCDDGGSGSREIGQTSFRTHNPHFMWNREWFEETVELPFEDITITCPKQYDEFLRKQFGDWHTPVFNGSMHEFFIFDTETPYYKNARLAEQMATS